MKTNTNIKCPHCHEAFKIDETAYESIVKQIRDKQFDAEIAKQAQAAAADKANAVALAKAEIENNLQQKIANKDQELTTLKAQLQQQFTEELAKKEQQVKEKELQLNAAKHDKEQAIKVATTEVTAKLQAEIATKEHALISKEAQFKQELTEAIAKKETQISAQNAALQQAKTAQELAVKQAVTAIEKERDQLLNSLKGKETEQQLAEKSLQQQFQQKLALHEETLKLKDGEIERLKDFKQKQSTKMLGESLEQHCEIEFNKLRATAFQNAYFEKDNDASGGTKGDFIFKEEDGNGNEIISIMFEMKNENDETATKKKNEDFFAKLDKDRNDKNCEYAVLVSALETDNDFYNTGIVDVSYRFPKMFVIRPQFFIPMITLLRNSGLKSLSYKAELNAMRNQNLDVTNFEEKINNIREGFGKNYLSASTHFEQAIKEIDNSISKMQKVKSELITTGNQLRLANQKLEGLTIKKLTYNNPTMKEKLIPKK